MNYAMRHPALLKTLLFGLGFGGMLLYVGDWRVWIFAWITPVVLLYLVRSSRWLLGLFPLFVMAVGASMIARQGLSPLSDWVSLLIGSTAFAVSFILPFVFDKLLHQKLPRVSSTLVFPASLVVLELANAYGQWGAWGQLVHTQFELVALMQSASLLGAFVVTFFIAWFAPMVLYVLKNRDRTGGMVKAGVVYAVLLVSLVTFGAMRLELGSSVSKTVPIAAIINDTDLFGLYLDPQNTQEFMSTQKTIEHQLARTEQAANAGAKIIAWNEGSLILDPDLLDRMMTGVKSICLEYQVYVLPSYTLVIKSPNEKPFLNRNVLVAPDGEVKWTYDKAYPVPMVELPLVAPGSGVIPYHDSEYGRLGTVICFDMDVHTLLRQASSNDIDILLVPAADWEGITPIHTQMASLEAIQNGFSLVRICSHGFTGAYDWRGTLLAGLNDFESDSDIALAHVPTRGRGTLYGIIGHAFAFVCLMFMAGSIFYVTFITIRQRFSNDMGSPIQNNH